MSIDLKQIQIKAQKFLNLYSFYMSSYRQSFNDLFKVIDSTKYETESRIGRDFGTLLKCESRFILFSGIDTSKSSFDLKLSSMNNINALKYVLETLVKNENVVVFFEETLCDNCGDELRFIIFKLKDKNISHLNSVHSVRNLINNALGDNELPDFPYVEISNGRVCRLLRLNK